MNHTKKRILDTAERLFASFGLEATSLRAITTDACVNLAAVNYHFQSKDALIDAVIRRRLEPLSRRRLEMLAACGPSPSLEEVLKAFLAPVVEASGEEIVRRLIGRLLASPEEFLDRIFKPHLGEVAQRFGEAFARALPHLSDTERLWRMHFLLGSMAHVMAFSDVLPHMSNGLCDASDHERLTRRLIGFAAAGLRAPQTEGI